MEKVDSKCEQSKVMKKKVHPENATGLRMITNESLNGEGLEEGENFTYLGVERAVDGTVGTRTSHKMKVRVKVSGALRNIWMGLSQIGQR